jgi:hypothetical protein
MMPRTRSPADHPARRVAFPDSAACGYSRSFKPNSERADSDTELREAEARKDVARSSVDKFRYTATSL